MNYNKQLKKQKRKQLKIEKQQELQKQKYGSSYSASKPPASKKALLSFVFLCGLIANSFTAKAEAATFVQSVSCYEVNVCHL